MIKEFLFDLRQLKWPIYSPRTPYRLWPPIYNPTQYAQAAVFPNSKATGGQAEQKPASSNQLTNARVSVCTLMTRSQPW